MAKKRKGLTPERIVWTKEDMKVIAWCHKNGITMCTIPVGKDFKIEIKINGKLNCSPFFNKFEVYEKQKEYYYYYFNKYSKKKRE